ncbi:MAG: sugar phosphate isomerase/epimerase family protein [Armatimonadota bacterium]
MYVSCSSSVEARRELPEALARISELGFGHLDLFVMEHMRHISPAQLAAEPTAVATIAGAVRSSGLLVSSLNCGFSVPFTGEAPARRQMEREYRAMLELAEAVSCTLLTIGIGSYGERVGKVESFDRALAGLRWLAGLTRQPAVRLSFEPHFGSAAEKPADALYLAKRVWPDVGVTYDPSHFAMQPDVGPLAGTEELMAYTVHVHVRNAAPGRMQAPMAEGTVDFRWLVEALRKRGYTGAVAIEYLDGAEEEALKLRQVLGDLGVTG